MTMTKIHTKTMTKTKTKTVTKTNTFTELLQRAILVNCNIWDTDYFSDIWEPEFMTIFVTRQLRVKLDSIRNSCDASNQVTPQVSVISIFIPQVTPTAAKSLAKWCAIIVAIFGHKYHLKSWLPGDASDSSSKDGKKKATTLSQIWP